MSIAGPVGLFTAYLACSLGLSVTIVDEKPVHNLVGRADALNEFKLRESAWWDQLTGCQYKHFLMVGQAYLEQILIDRLLSDFDLIVKWKTRVQKVSIDQPEGAFVELSPGGSICDRRRWPSICLQNFIRYSIHYSPASNQMAANRR